MLSKRRTIMITGGVLLATGVWWWVQRSPVIDVQVGEVTAGPMRVTIDETGTTRVRAHTDVNAPVTGRWLPAALVEGDAVRVGQRLGVLYPTPLDPAAREQAEARVGSAEALVREADARLAAARTALDEARRSRTRTEALVAAGGVAPQDVERARDAERLRETEVQAAEERWRVARYDRTQAVSVLVGSATGASGLPLTSPLAGAVLTMAEPHERVVAAGTRLLEVGDPSDLEVIVPLLTADAIRVQEGAEVRLTFTEAAVSAAAEAMPDTVLGRVRRIEPSAFTRLSALGVEEQRVNVVVAVPATAVHLGHHFRADARITIWESPRVVRVPASALVRDGDAWRVWRVRGTRTEQVAVRVGERGGEFVEVRDGLQAGDRVVLFPGDRLTNDARVRSR